MTKPNKGGWIRHRGGKCPVESGQYAEIRLRSGLTVFGNDVHECDWEHYGHGGDIMAWRPHKPSILDEAGEPNDALKDVLELDAAKKPEALILDYSPSLYIQTIGRVYRHEGDPRKMRDRILDIDAASKEEEARHCAAMAAYDEERASLVAKLKAEGFVLIQSDEPNSEVESAQDDIAQQDMSDWRNWEKGDIILCVKSDCYPSELTVGKLYIYHGDGDVIDDGGAEQGYPIRFGECFKWHSRPTN